MKRTIFLAIGMSLISAQKALKDNDIDPEGVEIVTTDEEARQHIRKPEMQIPFVAQPEIPIESLKASFDLPGRKQKQQFYKPHVNKFTKGRR